MKLNKVFFWACDYSLNSGEGRLGRLFIKEYERKFQINTKRIKPFKIKILNYKYLSPLMGIFIAWTYFFKNRKFIYLNYIPYWNFLIFLLLPPKSEIGPITGGSFFTKKSKDFHFRKFIFPILYHITSLILRYRFKNLIFSTDLLKKKLPNKIKKKSKFNFIFKEIKKNKKKNKNLNFLFYFRKHRNKEYSFPIEFINYLLKKNYSVNIVGDKLNIKNIKNYGYLSHGKVVKLLERTKFTIASKENIFSFFTLDAINNNVKILVDYKVYNSIKYYKKNFIKFNFKTSNLKKLKNVNNIRT